MLLEAQYERVSADAIWHSLLETLKQDIDTQHQEYISVE